MEEAYIDLTGFKPPITTPQVVTPLEAPKPEEVAKQERAQDSREDTFQPANPMKIDQATKPGSSNNPVEAQKPSFNPLSVEIDGVNESKEYTVDQFKTELKEILEAMSKEDLNFAEASKLEKQLDELLTEKLPNIKVDPNAQAPTIEETKQVQKLVDGLDKLTKQIDDQREDFVQKLENMKSGDPNSVLDQFVPPFKNLQIPGGIKSLLGSLNGVRPNPAILNQFANLVAKRRQAKLEQEALERRLETQIDRLNGIVQTAKLSIKLSSSQS